MNNTEDIFEKMEHYTLHTPKDGWKLIQKERAVMLKTCPVCGALPGYRCVTSRSKAAMGGKAGKELGRDKYTPHQKRLLN